MSAPLVSRVIAALNLVLILGLLACGAPRMHAKEVVLAGEGSASAPLSSLLTQARFTVLVFISAECPCVEAHDERLRQIAAAYRDQGVQVFAIDSEVGTTRASAAALRRERNYAFPVLLDRKARLANALGAEYAGYAVLMDAAGNVRYRGGIDSDKQRLHDDAVPYLRDALDDVLAGRSVRRAEARTLGCVLRKW
jgi:peroxiredoxin